MTLPKIHAHTTVRNSRTQLCLRIREFGKSWCRWRQRPTNTQRVCERARRTQRMEFKSKPQSTIVLGPRRRRRRRRRRHTAEYFHFVFFFSPLISFHRCCFAWKWKRNHKFFHAILWLYTFSRNLHVCNLARVATNNDGNRRRRRRHTKKTTTIHRLNKQVIKCTRFYRERAFALFINVQCSLFTV